MRKAIELAVFVAGVALFVTPTGLRVGTKGRVQSASAGVADILVKLPKGERRIVRKALHRNGHGGLASAGVHGTPQIGTRKAA